MPWLPWLAAGLLLGALAPGCLGPWWPAALGVALAGLWLAAPLPLAARWLALAGAAAVGTGIAPPPPTPVAESRLLAVEGTVLAVRWQGASQGFTVRDAASEDGTAYGRLFVRAPALPEVRAGDRVRARGVWTRGPRGDRLQAVELAVEPREAGPRGFAWRALELLDAHHELAAALLLGRGDPPERADFRAAGLSHLLAVSGMHFAIAAGLAWWLLIALGVGWRGRMAALAILLVGYTWLTHANPATLRACAMALAVAAYAALGREPARLGPLALAVLALLAWEPAMARDIGFQLSAAAVAGIVTLGLDLRRLAARALDLEPWPLDRPSWRALLWSARALRDGACLGLAAVLATAPIVAWHFGAVAPWSWLTSLVAGIPATLALWLGLPFVLGAGLWPDGPWAGLAWCLEQCLGALAASAAWSAAHLPQQLAAPPAPAVLLAWPLLFLPLADGRELLLRAAAAGLLILAW